MKLCERVTFVVCLQFSLCVCYYLEDAYLKTPQLITKYGYPAETHEIITEDDYILVHHRIPYGKNSNTTTNNPVVLLQHGFVESSSNWIIRGPEDSLAYKLADAGYDVWLLNTRGNEYSVKHKHLDPILNKSKFWNFCLHEVGIYDLPATIDYVLKLTNQNKLYHIGHSQGSATFYIMLSERPEYNDKIFVHLAYAPAAYVGHIFGTFVKIVLFAEETGTLENTRRYYGDAPFLAPNPAFRLATSIACIDGKPTQIFCSDLLYNTMGFSVTQLNYTLLPVIWGQFPAGSSLKQAIHFIQNIKSGEFRNYDNGPDQNLLSYEQLTPPHYKFINVLVPVYTFHGRKDSLASTVDVLKLNSVLPNLQETFNMGDWAHGDFLYGNGIGKHLNPIAMKILRTHVT